MVDIQLFEGVSKNDKDVITGVFGGDLTKLPVKGTLVAIDTASSGLVNVITTGNYNFRKSPCTSYQKLNEGHPLMKDSDHGYAESNKLGEFLISVEVCYLDNNRTTNTRFLDQLHFPVLKREKEEK
ncbi:hypothetical protein [Vibrio phage RYC]|nr:hypothetical protein [Vibrio phage RYC]